MFVTEVHMYVSGYSLVRTM